jgi:drug/metabolite transporter (DMT)-like permease
LAVLYMVIFGSIVAVNCYAFLLAHVPAQKVTTYALVNPVIALGLGALVLHEKVGPAAILSAILVLAGVALILFQRRAVSARPMAETPGVRQRSLP